MSAPRNRRLTMHVHSRREPSRSTGLATLDKSMCTWRLGLLCVFRDERGGARNSFLQGSGMTDTQFYKCACLSHASSSSPPFFFFCLVYETINMILRSKFVRL